MVCAESETGKCGCTCKALYIALQDHVVVGPDLRFVSIRKNLPGLWR